VQHLEGALATLFQLEQPSEILVKAKQSELDQ